jgi:hypothetical protein
MSYFIIYPGGDRSKIGIVNLSDAMRYELSDYAVASRREFSDDEGSDAREYAKHLAFENGKTYIPDEEDDYLD